MAKTLTGIVSSNKGEKTIVITVQTRRTHPLYKKQYSESTKIMAHDEKNEALVGDRVLISETRPISRRKFFTLVKILERALIREDQTVEAITAEPKPEPVVKEEAKPKKTAKAAKKTDEEKE